MDIGSVQAKADEIYELMGERLPVRGTDLVSRTYKAGRLLPRRIRKEALYLGEAAKLVENPKLMKMVDFQRVNTAFRACLHYLKSINVAARRRELLLGILGSIGLAIFVVSGLGIFVLSWRGYL